MEFLEATRAVPPLPAPAPSDGGAATAAAAAHVSHSSLPHNDVVPRSYKFASAHGEMNPRKRHTMEDCHRVLPQLAADLPQYAYFGVYDGHGGRQIVDFLEEALENNIAIELKEKDDATIEERLSRAFGITDMQSRKMEIVASGATAVAALLESSADGLVRKLYVANVGDSRAVLVTSKPPAVAAAAAGVEQQEPPSSSGYYGRRLTYDHRAEDETEQARIQQAGGFIARGRVLGILAVTRSFGDHGMKDFVVAEPYTTATALDDATCGECPLLILACDGVWDVMTDQEAADMLIQRWREKGGPDADAAQFLVKTAIKRGSADNITAIVIFL
jgi:serine/threonine protein phosphatase PrpC